MRITEWLKALASQHGPDLYLSTGAPPCAKFDGQLRPIGSDILRPGEIKDIAYEVMDATQQAEFEQELEMNLATSIPGFGRFRVNIFMQRNEVAMVCRNIVAEIPNWQDLRLPDILPEVIMRKRGLVLFVGATGSGVGVGVGVDARRPPFLLHRGIGVDVGTDSVTAAVSASASVSAPVISSTLVASAPLAAALPSPSAFHCLPSHNIRGAGADVGSD